MKKNSIYDSVAKLIASGFPILEALTVVPHELTKWHDSGAQLKQKLDKKKLNTLQRKIEDRISFHSDSYKSSTNKHDAAVHFMQMVKLHHLLHGIIDED